MMKKKQVKLEVKDQTLTDFTKYKVKLIVEPSIPKPKPRGKNLYKKQLRKLRKVLR